MRDLDTLPGPLADVVSLLEALPSSRVEAWSPQERADWLVGLQRVVDSAQAQLVEVLSAFDAAGDAELLQGARSTPAWLRGTLHWSARDAAATVALARAHHVGVVSDAVSAMHVGVITLDHAQVIGRSLRSLPQAAPKRAAQVLTDAARSLAVDELARLGRQVQHVVDPDGAIRRHDHDYTRRRLHMSALLDGMVAIDGILDSESAATLSAAFAPFLVPTSEDERTTPQRRADALVGLARHALDTQSVAELGKEHPHLTLLAGIERPTQPPGVTVVDPAEKLDQPEKLQQQWVMPSFLAGTATALPGEPVSVATAGRLSCDAALQIALLGGEGEVLFLGRQQRLFSPAQKHALAVRDGGCRFPNCGFPEAFTDAHHVVPWREGGLTDVTNGLLLCRFHHRLVHEGGWSITNANGGPVDTNKTVWFVTREGQRLRAALADNSRQRATGWLKAWAAPP